MDYLRINLEGFDNWSSYLALPRARPKNKVGDDENKTRERSRIEQY